MKEIVICGSGGHASEVRSIIEDINALCPTWRLIGYVGDGGSPGELIDGLPLLGDGDWLLERTKNLAVVLGIGNPSVCRRFYESLSENRSLNFPSLVHPLAHVSRGVALSDGVVLSPLCSIGPHASLGLGVFVHCGAFVGHDAVIGDFSFVLPGAKVLGAVTVGKYCYIGAGASVRQLSAVGDSALVGMGAVVVKDVPPGATVVGNPARILRQT